MTRSARRLSLAVAFGLLVFGVGALLLPAARSDGDLLAYLVIGAVLAAVIAVGIGLSARGGERPALEHRERSEELPPIPVTPTGHPYRARLGRALTAVGPKLSGKAVALVVTVSFGASALLLPALSSWPRWLEVELVIGAWWLIVFTTLSVLLYRGHRLRDDLVYFAPWDRGADAWAREPHGFTWHRSVGEGCSSLDAVPLLLAIGVLLGLAWLLVELALPLVFLMMYATFMRAIGRVANQRHQCEGLIVDTVLWAGLWATAYTLPLALLVLLLRLAGLGV